MSAGRYLAAAFNARPLGMIVPPNWLALAAFGLLGGFLNPGFWLIGVGLEIAYLAVLSRNYRFRRAVDARDRPPAPGWDQRIDALLARLDPADQRRQAALQARCAEVVDILGRAQAVGDHGEDLSRLCWLHLKLLVARAAITRVVATADAEAADLTAQQARLQQRLTDDGLADDLRHSLTQQQSVIDARLAAHRDARDRLEHVEAELARIDQQAALLRDQALLATDEDQVARSVDAISASLNEANRWLLDQQDLFGALDEISGGAPPADLLRRRQSTRMEESA